MYLLDDLPYWNNCLKSKAPEDCNYFMDNKTCISCPDTREARIVMAKNMEWVAKWIQSSTREVLNSKIPEEVFKAIIEPVMEEDVEQVYRKMVSIVAFEIFASLNQAAQMLKDRETRE